MLLFMHTLSLIALVLWYYACVVDWVFLRIPRSFLAEQLSRRYPARHVGAALGLGICAFLQAGFFFGLVALYRPFDSVSELIYIDPVLVVLGIILGIGEMGLATLLGLLAIRIIDACKGSASVSGRSPARATHWDTTARGGWMQCYLKAMAILPKPIAVGVSSLYVVFEEGVFRGVLLSTVAPCGAGLALVVSVLAFMIVQVFHTPGWRTALFPVQGALVVGVVHAVLFLKTHALMPLAVAHISYFFSAMWSIRGLKTTPSMNSLG